MDPKRLIEEIEQKLLSVQALPGLKNVGTVISVGDGVAKISGLSQAGFGEEVEFETGTRGLILALDEDFVFSILLADDRQIKEGVKVEKTGRILGINVSLDLIGRIIDPLGNPLDGKSLKTSSDFYPLEKIAPGVIQRSPVDTPLKTGIKAIDLLTPIGRGQRELIIGDRNTGKTAIAIDTIINQKKKDLGLRQVICVYCAIGQKRSNIARTVSILEKYGAMDYTIVVAASASDLPALIYLAPYAATAIAEYFMDKGEDVLVVYDDLTKHAWAYRQISLVLKRPAGREAYPGDIFYLHSRLLERSAKLSKEFGGGSITALPIIETQAGDVSAYIPTNVISITDGQIYLETDLFNAGVRPAINAGLSVSRVGGAAQSKLMKQFAGPLRLELAQYRELAAFAQFGSDLDEATQKRIERGKRVVEVLKQKQYSPLPEVVENIMVFAVTNGVLDELPIEKISEFEQKVVDYLNVSHKKLLNVLKTSAKLDDKTQRELKTALSNFANTLI
jgi:F-type H+-transporting ATPase subunit alpha